MDNIKKFYSLVFRGFSGKGEFINYRQLNIDGSQKTSNRFETSIDDLIENVAGKTDTYFGVAVRDKANSKHVNIVYSNIGFLDIDFHDFPADSFPELKQKAIDIIKKDIFLSQYFCIIDTGRGIHVYYLMPSKIYVATLRLIYKRLMDYAEGITFINKSNILDRKVGDIGRILRCPGTINSKTKAESIILEIKDKPIGKDFFDYLMASYEPAKNKSAYSTAEAMELCGVEIVPDENVICPFPDHKDTRPSFRYYSKTDTFWCFKCSPQKKYYDGLHFLTLMKRNDLIAQFKATTDVYTANKYVLTEDGDFQENLEQGRKTLAHFLSSKKIETLTKYQGRKVYIELDDDVVDITDVPNNRELKRRYLQANREFIANAGSDRLMEALTRWIQMANESSKRVIFNHGLNVYQDNSVLFYMNEKEFPTQLEKPVIGIDERFLPIQYKPYDFKDFINNLILDNNTSHLIGLIWGIATIARDIIIDKAGLFPILIATGMRESGKTHLARMVINLFGYNDSEELDTTPFAIIRKMQRYGTFPIHFDEYGNKIREKEHEELIKDISTSKLVIRERGNTARSTDKYYLQCPIIITGERNIEDAGVVSRSIILNLGKNKNKDDEAFDKWVSFYLDGRLTSFMQDFLSEYFIKYREYMNSIKFSRVRDIIKQEIIKYTYTFLVEKNILPDNLNMGQLIKIVGDSKLYKDSISSDGYTEILSEILSENFEPDEEETALLAELKRSIYFDINNKVVFLSITNLFNCYKLVANQIKHYGRIATQEQFRLNFIQCPDFITMCRGQKTMAIFSPDGSKARRRITNAVALRISEHNKEYLRYMIQHKIYDLYNTKYKMDDILDQADKLLDMLENADDPENTFSVTPSFDVF